jgi:outer membrane protein OmpA-like peptidoglycan-associated protein
MAKLAGIVKNPVIDGMKPQFISLIAALAAPAAFAQSTMTLDSFSLEDSTAAKPAETAPAGSSLETCLTNPASCASDEHQSGWEPSLDDVLNIGVIDREEVAQQTSTAGGSVDVTEPLPSVDMEILFDYNSDTVRGDQIGQLAELAALLKSEKFSGYRFLFLGHTDAKGSAAYNQDLSARRAESVAQLVRGMAGLEGNRTMASGMGFAKLKTPGDPFGGQNRRVQLVLVPR